MKHKEKILELRKQGKSYKEIQDMLGCSKGTISYHCGNIDKEQKRNKNRKFRAKQHPYQSKLEHFFDSKPIKHSKTFVGKSTRILYLKLKRYTKSKDDKYMKVNFTVQDILDKFGDTPKCYLTGQEIDISKSNTYSFDHKIPISRGGESSLENLGITTKLANQAKTNMTPDEFINLCKVVLENQGYTVTK